MATNTLFEYNHPRLGPVAVQFSVSKADITVGIMEPYMDGFTIIKNGTDITELLTITESNAMEDLIQKKIDESDK